MGSGPTGVCARLRSLLFLSQCVSSACTIKRFLLGPFSSVHFWFETFFSFCDFMVEHKSTTFPEVWLSSFPPRPSFFFPQKQHRAVFFASYSKQGLTLFYSPALAFPFSRPFFFHFFFGRESHLSNQINIRARLSRDISIGSPSFFFGKFCPFS